MNATVLRSVAAVLGSALVPARCAGCDAPGAWLCHGCRDALEPLSLKAGSTLVRGAGAHAGLRHAVHRFKYREERALAIELAELVAELLLADLARGERCDALVPVPLHPARARARGYDQTALLADSLAVRTGIGIVRAVRRIRHGRPQVEQDRAERARSAQGAFVGCAGALRGMRVAVIDDVATTGATCAEVATVARACGARSVRAYVVAIDE